LLVGDDSAANVFRGEIEHSHRYQPSALS
jgi:hypothetical protein